MRKHQLIVQFTIPSSDAIAQADLLLRHEVEHLLDAALRRQRVGYVDGGDIGTGTMNIFCWVASWGQSIEIVLAHLRHRNLLDRAILAKRLSSGAFEVVWPQDYRETFAIS